LVGDPILEGQGPGGLGVAGERPEVGVGVEVTEDNGGHTFIKVVLKEVTEAVAAALEGDFMIDVEEAGEDLAVVEDVKGHCVEVGGEVVRVGLNVVRCEERFPRVGSDLAYVGRAVCGEVEVLGRVCGGPLGSELDHRVVTL